MREMDVTCSGRMPPARASNLITYGQGQVCD